MKIFGAVYAGTTPVEYKDCLELKLQQPNTPSGAYTIAGKSRYCDMTTQGGGWTYVARGTSSADGDTTAAYGSNQNNPTVNTRWSVGQAEMNIIAGGAAYKEYYVTMGANNNNNYALGDHRAFRVAGATTIRMDDPMDATYGVQVRLVHHT